MSIEKHPILSRQECEALVTRIEGYVRGGGETSLSIVSVWNGELRWARNRVALSSDRALFYIKVDRTVKDVTGEALTNQTDPVSLESVVRCAERAASMRPNHLPQDFDPGNPSFPYPNPKSAIWSDATTTATVESRGKLAQILTQEAENQSMISAGYLEMRAYSFASVASLDETVQRMTPQSRPANARGFAGRMEFAEFSQSQCSMTVRHPKGTGSGWAGLSSYDWNAIDAPALAQRALDRCLRSLNPVRIEPGRYTVILEPQAVADLVDLLFGGVENLFSRKLAESGRGPFPLEYDRSLDLWRTKLGLKVVDDRLSLTHDPADPVLGVIPTLGLEPITWIRNGVLETLDFDRLYSAPELVQSKPVRYRPAYRLSGGSMTVDEMIASTKRGLLVSRFSNMRVLDVSSALATGVTRDGLWLIEQGKISKSVNNMRITESPLFVLNQVEHLGVPVPVFRPDRYPLSGELRPAVVPAITSRDFSFTSTIDAV